MAKGWGHVGGARKAWLPEQLTCLVRAPKTDVSARALSKGFIEEEEGSTVILSMFILIFMLAMGGLGVDLMRYEMERTHLQATLDSAVLAGAGAPQGSEVDDVKAIVVDYFEKNDMSDYLQEFDTDGEGEDDIETSLNATRVYAEATMDMQTYLMQMTGVEELTANGAAEAMVSTPKLEVAVVLDVSGSMYGTKMTNMQTAAKSFVTTILNSSDPGNTVISLVPFAWNVTPGVDIYDALTVNESHDYSTCLRFDSSDYSDVSIDPDTSYDQQIFTSVYGNFDDHSDGWRSCFPEDSAEILPYSMDETALHNHIDALEADGNTSAHIGMKWGAALLDSEFDEVVDHLQSASVGIVDASLENIPAVYGESETLKVIVLMADGRNTYSYYFDEDGDYRGANSDLILMEWRETEVFQYAYREKKKGGTKISYDESKCSNSKWTCVYEAGEEEISARYLEHDSEYYDIENDEWLSQSEFDDLDDLPGYELKEGFPSRYTWEEAWGFMSPEWYGDVTGDWGPWNDYVGSDYESGSTKDTRMQSICTATKNEGVVVYTIGYSISSGGNAETQLQDCASTANHYYPTDGANISSAFSSIASNVKNLRLTQ